MATFLFVVVPAQGHLNPTLATAVELRNRGHRVGYATGTDVRGVIESEGLEFLQVGPPGLNSHESVATQKMLKYKGLLSNYYFYKVLMEYDREALKDLRQVADDFKPDVMVVDAITHAGAQVAERYGLPWATIHPVPGLIPSRSAPPFTSWGLPPSDSVLVQRMYDVIRCGQNVFFRFFDPQ